jgi:DNA-binding NarL/FixJ family response regulator
MRPTRLLIVDRCPAVRDGLQSLFAQHAPVCQLCALETDAAAALARLPQLQPDIALIEHELGLPDPVELAAQLKGSSPALGLIIYGGAILPWQMLRLDRSKVGGVILKSDPAEELLFAVETVRRGHRFRSRSVRDRCEEIERGRALLHRLTRREIEVLRLIGEGYCTKEIADRLGVCGKTIETHRSHVSTKLNVHGMGALVSFAWRYGIIEA